MPGGWFCRVSGGSGAGAGEVAVDLYVGVDGASERVWWWGTRMWCGCSGRRMAGSVSGRMMCGRCSTRCAFDFSVWELGRCLYGGRLVVVPHEVSRFSGDFLDLLVRERVTVLNQDAVGSFIS